ncbi:STY0301 family protein [Kluyvera sichuanensis]|uniref:STY0301 family protein n=1 Tax=Kluyvera sichuanensis TaxID=2725494 RepID=UPI0034A2D091
MQKRILSLNNICIIGGWLWLLPIMTAHAEEIVCPAVIHFSQAPKISSIEGWNVSSRAERMLNDGGFLSSGDPKEQADLKGEDAVVDGKKGTRWVLGAEDNHRGVWFSCSYGTWTVLLARKLQGAVTTCWSPDNLPARLICN